MIRLTSLCFLSLLMTFGGLNTFGQGVGISESSITPHASSILELRSDERGFLVPRMDTDERDDISDPANGLVIYNTDVNKLNIYDESISSWRIIFSGNVGINNIFGTDDRIVIDDSDPANPIIDIDLNYAGQTSINTLGTITTGVWNGSTIAVPFGGTGLTSITENNLIYGNGTGSVNLLAPSGTTGALLMNTAAGAPSWQTLNDLPSSSGILQVQNGGTGVSSLTQHGVVIGQGTGGVTTTSAGTAGQVLQSRGGTEDPSYSTAIYPTTTSVNELLYSSSDNNITGLATANGGILNTSATGVPSITATPVLGLAGTRGTITLAGNTSGAVTIQPQAVAGTYNFNLPIAAGSAGQPLLSGGGGASPMTFGTLGVPAGGTGLTSGVSGGIPYFSSTTTMASSALLEQNRLLIGGGAGNAPSTLALGTGNQLLGMNAGGSANEYKTLSGTTNRISVVNAANSITLSAPLLRIFIQQRFQHLTG